MKPATVGIDDRSPSPKRRDVTVLGFGMTLAVLAVGGLLGCINAWRLNRNDQLVDHTHQVIGELESLLSALKDAETGQRGYLLVEDQEYLEPYDDALERVRSTLARLKKLVSGDADRQARLAELERTIGLKLGELQQTIALMKLGDRPAALKVVRSDAGKALMDDARDKVASIQQDERELLLRRAEESKDSFLAVVWSILLTAAVGVALVGAVFYLNQRGIRQRRQAAEVLAEQRERLRVTLASIGDAVIATDAKGRVTFVNPVAQALTGWTDEAASGKPLDEVFVIVNEETRNTVENPALRALHEGSIVGLANHTLLIAKDGTERPIDDSAAPIRDAKGAVRGAVLVFRDVTERRLHELALEGREQQFRTLAESIPQLAWMADPDGHIFWYNRRWYDYTGTTLEQMQGWGWQSVHDPDELPKVMDRWKASIASGSPFDMVFPLKGRHGEFRSFLTRVEPVKDDKGRVVRWFGTNTDVTEQRQSARRVAESEARKAAILDTALDCIITIDHEGKIVEFNPAAELTFGHRRADAIGREMAELIIPPAFRQRHRDGIAAYLATGSGPILNRRVELTAMRPDGTEFPVEASITPILGEQHPLFTGHLRDITERKQMEDRLRRLVAELSEADRRKDEFLATLAHELRNPLAPIRNGLQLMRVANGQASTIEQARAMMERQLTQLVRLVDDLMDVSRITRGRVELRKERVELAAVVQSAIETSRPLIEEMGHELTVALPQRPVVINADPTRLAQVFSNLLNNAAKYSDKGGRIRLAAEMQGADVVVSVSDTGAGIDADQLPRIFGMFAQVDGSLERSQGGLGIGLTLVKRLVEMHGGGVEARSEGLGKGSEFIVRLPAVTEAAEPAAAVSEGPAAAKSSFRVLVVDDNRDGADSLAMMLRVMGNDTRTAYDGQEGVNAAEEFRPDVVLLDIGLPSLNGYEACRRIREQPWGQGMLLIAVTGWGQDEDRRRSHEAGFDRHMVKPVDANSLMKMLARLHAAKE